MSPEVLAEQGYDMQSDWWSLGIVLFELATGTPPFQDANLEAMADNIRFGDLPTRNYFSDEFEDLLQRLTHKLPDQRLGKDGGASEIKKHPFFRGVDWRAVIQKQKKPPIVPAKRATNICPSNDKSGEVNPYALLNCNFESTFYNRDICMWKEPTQVSPRSSMPKHSRDDSPNGSDF